LVIGVDRRDNAAALRQAGARRVVSDLWELLTGLMPGRHGPKRHKLLQTARNIAAAEALLIQQPWRLVLPSPARGRARLRGSGHDAGGLDERAEGRRRQRRAARGRIGSADGYVPGDTFRSCRQGSPSGAG